jgi:enamine deaminase RidA (YjgF/YER057c/UK114 family)
MKRFSDGSPWEPVAGYSRAVRRGSRIEVSGTTAADSGGSALYPGDVYAQTRHAIEKGIVAVEALGGGREDVVRSRVYLAPRTDWREAGRAHAELLGDVAPANTTLFVAGFVGEGFLVEVELAAETVGDETLERR